MFRLRHVLILWGIEGCGQVLLGDDFTELPAEHLAVLFPGTIQCLEAGSDEAWEYCWWTMDGPQAGAITAGFGFGEGIWRVGPAPLEQIFELDRQIRRPGLAGEIGASARAYQLLATAAQACRSRGGTRPDPVLAAADNLVEERWAEPGFGVEEIAAALGMHRSTLSRRFRAATGMTLISHLNTVRLQNAMGMLRGGNATVSEVAARCGFSDVTYFCRVFRNQVGVSPGAFRKQG